MKLRILSLILAVALLIPGGLLWAQNDVETGNLTGFVTDLITGEAIEGAVVGIIFNVRPKDTGTFGDDSVSSPAGLRKFFTKTDENGAYLIEDIPVGSYKVVSKAKDYYPAFTEVQIQAGETAQADFELNPCINGATGNLSGIVIDAVTGEPIVGAKVAVRIPFNFLCDKSSPGEVRRFFDETDENGEYFIEDIPIGEYKAGAGARSYEVSIETVVIEYNQTTSQNFELMPCDYLDYGSVSGVVTDEETGEAITGAMIFIRVKDYTPGCGFPMLKAVQGEDGSYSFDKVPAGTHLITALALGYERFTGEVTVETGQNTEYDIALKPLGTGTLTGIVVDTRLNPVEGARAAVVIKKAKKSILLKRLNALTDRDGRFVIEKVPVGFVKVVAAKAGVGAGFTTAEIVEDQITEVSIVLSRNIPNEE